MSRSARGQFLQAAADELSAAWGHLQFSASSVDKFSSDENWDEAALEKVEAYTSRFARVVDLLTTRVLRAIDQFELLEPGTLIDVANRAEARGWIPSVDWLRELKDVRKRIAHDYSGEQLIEIFRFCQSAYGQLEASVEQVLEYIDEAL